MQRTVRRLILIGILAAVILSGWWVAAAQEDDSAHESKDSLTQILSLWPWLLPLLPLSLLAWLLRRRPKGIMLERPERVDSPLAMPPLEKPSLAPLPIEVRELAVLWEPRPALIVGLGETGRRVLTHLKKNLLDASNGQMPDGIRLLCIDTGDYVQLKHGDQAAAVAFAGVELSRDEILELTESLRPLLDRDLDNHPEYAGWLSQSTFKQLGEQAWRLEGTSQRRPLARAGFLQQLQAAEDNLLTRVRALAPACLEDEDRSSRTLHVFIIGDTHGDVGSALLLDVAIIARRVGQELGVVETTTAAHLLAHCETVPEQVNTTATLREIMRYQLADAFPFDAKMGVPELDGKCDWLPLDRIQLYDSGDQHGFAAQRRFHPVIADVIAASLDKATDLHDLRNMARAEDAELRRVQHSTHRVHVATENSYQYRLPFYDLINSLCATFMREVVHRLINGNNPGQRAVDETYVHAGETAKDLALYFLTGRWILNPAPPAALLSMTTLLKGTDDQTDLRNALRDLSRHNPEALLRERLVNAVSTILNGHAYSHPFSGRAGKVRLLLEFLTALPRIIVEIQKLLTVYTTGDQGRGAASLRDALDKLTQLAALLLAQLQVQMEALGVDPAGADSLYGRLTWRQTNLMQVRDEMERVASRATIWDGPLNEVAHSSESVPLEAHWYAMYLLPRLEEALHQFYWEVGEDGIVLTLTVDQVVALDPADVGDMENELYRLATTFCEPIRNEETLANLLRTGPLAEYQVINTAQMLLDQSRVSLAYAEEQSLNQRWDVLLVANGNIAEADQLANYIRPRLVDPESLKWLRTSDPFVLGIKQRRSILPLDVTDLYRRTLEPYRAENGLMSGANGVPVHQRPLSAIYEAEQIALDLEARMAPEINVMPNLLHPLVVIGLTAPKRAHAYCLALASGEIGVKGLPPDSNQEYAITLYAAEVPDGEQVFPIPASDWQSPLHPLLQGYLWFVNDRQVFSMALIDELLERYRTDPKLLTIWEDWLDDGWREYVDHADEFNRAALIDLINITRLWVIDLVG